MAYTQEQELLNRAFKQISKDHARLTADLAGLKNGVPGGSASLAAELTSVDDTSRIQNFLNVTSPGTVRFAAGTYKVSKPIYVPDGVHVEFDRRAVVKVTADLPTTNVGGNDARYAFLMGNNTSIRDAVIDVQNRVAGGIAAIQKGNVMFHNCSVKNWKGVFGIADIGCFSVWYSSNTVKNGVHGLHSYASLNVFMSENDVDVMTGGGIYTGWSDKVLVMSNHVRNCGDVGIDFEGGSYCLSLGNTIERCKNGELALFSGNDEKPTVPNNLIHRGNIVRRTATYVTGYTSAGNEITANVDTSFGACSFMSVAPNSFTIGFDGNTLNVEAGIALFHYQGGDTTKRDVFFTNNIVRSSGGFWRCLNSVGLNISNNEFYGLAGSQGYTNELRDAERLTFRGNEFDSEVKRTSGYVLLLNTSVGDFVTTSPVVSHNGFKNTPGRCIQVDSFNNGDVRPILKANDFGDDYTSNGGVDISPNGFVILKNQVIRLLLQNGPNNIAAVPTIGRANTSAGSGMLVYGTNNLYNATADVHYLVGNGCNIIQRIPAVDMSATAAGATITLSGPDCTGRLDLVLNSY